MDRRLELQSKLEELLGSENVYFQPPESDKLKYPCIIYLLSSVDTMYANGSIYSKSKQYLVTVVDRDPDSELPWKILKLPYCSFVRSYSKDGLNNFVFNLYF